MLIQNYSLFCNQDWVIYTFAVLQPIQFLCMTWAAHVKKWNEFKRFFLTHCVLDAGSLFHFGKENNGIETNNGNNGPLCVAAKHNGHEYLTSILFDICSSPPYGVTLSVHIHNAHGLDVLERMCV